MSKDTHSESIGIVLKEYSSKIDYDIKDAPGNFPCPFCKIPFYTLGEMLDHREKNCNCSVTSSNSKEINDAIN